MRIAWVLQILLVLLIPSAIYAHVHRGDPVRALRGAGLVLAGVYVAFVAPFVIGETIADPGGWRGIGLVAAWVVPMVVLALLARWRPTAARWVLLACVLAMVGVYAWSAVAPGDWRAFEDRTGPVRGVATMALAAPLAVLALQEVRDAARLLLALAAMPVVVALVLELTGRGSVPLSLAVLDAPLLVVAGLLLASAHLDDRGHRRATPRSQPRLPGAPRGGTPRPTG